MNRSRHASPRRVRPLVLLSCGLAGALAGCGKGGEQGHAGGPPGFGGPVPVTAVTVQPEAVPLSVEYTGRVHGSREVEVRARVTGILEKRHYKEGERVKAGEALFTLDPEPYQAAVARAQADLAAAEARHARAQRDAERLKPLFADRAVSQKEYDDAVSGVQVSAADVQAARARLHEAKLNLGYTRVTAPISGITSRAQQHEGTLVSGPDVLLTTVTQTDPIRVIFGVPDNDRLSWRNEAQHGRLTLPKQGQFTIRVVRADGSEYSREGKLDFTDVRINPETGTSEAQATLPNPEGTLHAGEFARVRLVGAVRQGVYKVPQRAVLDSPQGKFVFIADAQNKSAIRPVQVGQWDGDTWVVTAGLKPGERVIVDGTAKLMMMPPGVPVQIGDAEPPAGSSAARQGG